MNQYVTVLKKVKTVMLLVVVAVSVVLFSCSTPAATESDSTKQQMADYYSIEGVYRYHTSLVDALNNSSEALAKEDEGALDRSIDELNDICDSLKNVVEEDIPEQLEAYHEQMLKVAKSINDYTTALEKRDYEKAAVLMDDIVEGIEKTKGLIPE